MDPYRKETVPRRNDRCPCGSGKKAKRCCLAAIKALAALPPELRQQVVVAKILGRPILTLPPATQPQDVSCADADADLPP